MVNEEEKKNGLDREKATPKTGGIVRSVGREGITKPVGAGVAGNRFRLPKFRMRQESRRRKEPSQKGDELEQKIISIRRVSRVYKGGKRLRMSVFVVVGDKKGRVGLGLGKGPDVKSAAEKAYRYAKDRMVTVKLKGNTIPHEVIHSKGAAKVMLKPASPGTGVIAGSVVRAVVELAGVKDVLTKVLGTSNSINNAYCTFEALRKLKETRL